MRVAIYSRKSKFVEGSESLENQIQLCKEYIDKYFKNVEEFLIYEDEGFSGKNTERPQFKQLIKDAKNKHFDKLICYRLDRVSRNIADFSGIINLLQDNNIDFISIREQFDTSTPMGRAMMYIASVFAQLERETIAERVKDNMLELAKTGRWLGGQTPYGYISEGSKDNIKLIASKKEIKIVEQIFEKYLELGSLSRLQGWTVNNGIRTRKGKIFDYSSLRTILSNPVYVIADKEIYNFAKDNKIIICNTPDEFANNTIYGVMPFNRTDQRGKRVIKKEMDKWIIAIGSHNGIIESSTWLRAQDLIAENASKSPRTDTSIIALLSTLLKCKDCGSTFRIMGKYVDGKLRHHYYKCRTKEKSRGLLCSIKNINGYEAEKMVIDYVKNLDIDKYITKIKYEEYNETTTDDIVDKIEDIQTTIKKNNESIEKLTEKLIEVENSVASKYVISKIEKLDEENKNLQKQLRELGTQRNENGIRKINYEILLDEMKYAKANIDKLEHEQQKKLLRSVIEVIYWDGENLEVKPRL